MVVSGMQPGEFRRNISHRNIGKLVVLEHISLDGVIQAPGGPQEDTSGGFAHGGWVAPYSDEVLGTALRKQMNRSFDLLLGRKTFEIWEPYWPQSWRCLAECQQGHQAHRLEHADAGVWQPSVFLSGDVAAKVAE